MVVDKDRSLVVDYLPTNDIENLVSMISVLHPQNGDITSAFNVFDIYFWIFFIIGLIFTSLTNYFEYQQVSKRNSNLDYMSRSLLNLFEPIINKTSE